MPHGYSEIYLDSSMDILSQAFDWVANTCEDDLTLFADRFANSQIGRCFEHMPRYIAGCNGAELANMAMESLGLPEYDAVIEFWLDKSPEYWVGWILAYYQWKKNIPFYEILKCAPIERLLRLYHLGHEQDEEHVCDILDEWAEKC